MKSLQPPLSRRHHSSSLAAPASIILAIAFFTSCAVNHFILGGNLDGQELTVITSRVYFIVVFSGSIPIHSNSLSLRLWYQLPGVFNHRIISSPPWNSNRFTFHSICQHAIMILHGSSACEISRLGCIFGNQSICEYHTTSLAKKDTQWMKWIPNDY